MCKHQDQVEAIPWSDFLCRLAHPLHPHLRLRLLRCCVLIFRRRYLDVVPERRQWFLFVCDEIIARNLSGLKNTGRMMTMNYTIEVVPAVSWGQTKLRRNRPQSFSCNTWFWPSSSSSLLSSRPNSRNTEVLAVEDTRHSSGSVWSEAPWSFACKMVQVRFKKRVYHNEQDQLL